MKINTLWKELEVTALNCVEFKRSEQQRKVITFKNMVNKEKKILLEKDKDQIDISLEKDYKILANAQNKSPQEFLRRI